MMGDWVKLSSGEPLTVGANVRQQETRLYTQIIRGIPLNFVVLMNNYGALNFAEHAVLCLRDLCSRDFRTEGLAGASRDHLNGRGKPTRFMGRLAWTVGVLVFVFASLKP